MFSWNPNGTLTLAKNKTRRFCLLDTEAIVSTVETISGKLSEISDFVFQATKLTGFLLLENFPYRLPLMALGPLSILKKGLKYQLLSMVCSTLGYGKPEEVRERKTGEMELRIFNPFYPPASTGLITGMIEYLSGSSFSATYELQGEAELLVSIYPSSGKARISSLDLNPPLVSGRNVIELCTACRTPLDISSRFFFDIEQGEIQEIQNSGRAAFVDVACLRTVLNEVERETRNDIPALILRLEKERVRRIYESQRCELPFRADEYMKHARTLRIRGMGNVSSASVSGRLAKVRVDNPYHEALVAAFVAGFHEAVTGEESRVEWTPPVRGTTYVSVSNI